MSMQDTIYLQHNPSQDSAPTYLSQNQAIDAMSVASVEVIGEAEYFQAVNHLVPANGQNGKNDKNGMTAQRSLADTDDLAATYERRD